MKTIHIVMTINFVLLALFGTWTYSLTTQHQYQCTTDTECEQEEANLSKGK